MKDITIVGCGISGLNLGVKLIKKYGKNVTIYDRNNYVGGRVFTDKKKVKGKMVAFDTGAARFNNNQKNILRLIKHYGLEKNIVAIPNDWQTILTNSSKTYGENNNLDVNKILHDLFVDTRKNTFTKKKLCQLHLIY